MNRGVKRSLQIGLPILIILCIAGYSLGLFFKKEAEVVDVVPKTTSRASTVLPVTGVIATLTSSNTTIDANGNLLSNEVVELVSQTVGQVKKIYFNDGDFVKKGTLLLKVDDADLQAQLKREEYQKDLLKIRLDRQKVLLDRESISLEEYQLLETEYNKLLADIELIKVRIDRTEIRAPFDGQMGLRYVSEGSYLQNNTLVSTIVDNSILKLEFFIPERYIKIPWIGREVTLQTRGIEKPIVATIYAIDPQTDNTHQMIVRAKFVNKLGLIAGMFVQGKIPLAETDNYISIPSEAVVPEMDGKTLWVKKNGKATSISVETEGRDNRFVNVVSGIQPGDTVLTGGLMQLREGMPVDVTIQQVN